MQKKSRPKIVPRRIINLGAAARSKQCADPEYIRNRFWSKVERRGNSECWTWIGCICHGYGWFRFRDKNWSAHSVSYVLTHGDYDFSLDCCHKCDNRACVNPNHLFLGTRSDNIRDAMQKGRWKYPPEHSGEKNPQHILTESQVKEIRRIHGLGGKTQREIARQFGVNFRTVNYVLSRKLWSHI